MKVYALSAVEAGLDLIRGMQGRGVQLAGVIALSDAAERSAAAGFLDAGSLDEPLGVPVHHVHDYSLRSDADRALLAGLDMDVLVVAGWQRLVPEWLIDHCRLGVLGLHGSPRGITAGRGRSPQNWALICGAPVFEIAVFRIDPGVDSGPVLARRRFTYTAHDDIVSSYQKSMLLSSEMIASVLRNWDEALAIAEPQEDASAAYMPQRIAADGALDWACPAEQVRRQVAALTRPYPGAFCGLAGGKIVIWRARPIGDVELLDRGVPGQVIQIAHGRGFIVRAGDGYLMVDEFEADDIARPGLKVGAVLESVPLHLTIRAVVDRHRARFPRQPISPDVLALLRDDG